MFYRVYRDFLLLFLKSNSPVFIAIYIYTYLTQAEVSVGHSIQKHNVAGKLWTFAWLSE